MLKGPAWRPSSQLTGFSNLFTGLDVSRYGSWRAITGRGKLIICYAPKKSSRRAKQSSKGQVGQAHKFGRVNLLLSTCRGISQSQRDDISQQYSRSCAIRAGQHFQMPSCHFQDYSGQGGTESASGPPPRIIDTSQLSLKRQKRFVEAKKVRGTPPAAPSYRAWTFHIVAHEGPCLQNHV